MKKLKEIGNEENNEDYKVDIDLVDLNDEIYKIVRDNHFKNYFKVGKDTLKLRVINSRLKDSASKWLKNLYVKNL